MLSRLLVKPLLLFPLIFFIGCSGDSEDSGSGNNSGGSGGGSGSSVSSVGTARVLSSSTPGFSDAQSSGTVSINSGDTTFFAGYRQVSGISQDPIILRYDSGNLTWSYTDYESGGADGGAYGLLYDSDSDSLYGVFSVDGEQSPGFGRHTSGGWLDNFTPGGNGSSGGKVVVLLKLGLS